MRIFITGGTGFIGQHVVRRFLRGRDRLLLLVRRHIDAGELFPKSRRLEFLRGDLARIKKLEPQIKKFKPDVCVHLAWEGIPDYGVQMSIRNLEYGLELIQLLARVGCKKVIVSGSCWEYGAEVGKIGEGAPLNPQSPFAAAKVALSFLGREIARANNMDFVWLRFFYVYGPGQKKTSLIPHLIERMQNGLAPDLRNPKGGNDFVFVDDVANAVVAAARKRNAGGIYNIGSGKVTAVVEIANLVYGKNIVRRRRPKGFYADISLAKKFLGWVPTVSIKNGIWRILHYEKR